MNKTPFFSVITASFNSEKTISKTIESLLNQTYTGFEYIIIDGNSNDSTLEIIKSFEGKFKEKNIVYKFISESDKGIYDAWNKGINLSAGEWISFVGSDDYYLPESLTIYDKAIKSLKADINYISSKIIIIDEKENELNTIGEKFVWKNFLKKMDIAQVGSFHKKELFEQIGTFSTNYKIVGDLDFYLRAKDVIKPSFLNLVTGKMMNNGVSNQINKALKEALIVRLKYGYQSRTNIYFNHFLSLIRCHGSRIKQKGVFIKLLLKI